MHLVLFRKKVKASYIFLLLFICIILWYILVLSIPFVNETFFLHQFGKDEYFLIWTPIDENNLWALLPSFFGITAVLTSLCLYKLVDNKSLTKYLFFFWIFLTSIIYIIPLFSQDHICSGSHISNYKVECSLFEGVDIETFRKYKSGFAIDKNNVYCISYHPVTISPLKWVDVGSFEEIDLHFAKDKNYIVYHGFDTCTILSWADVNTWRSLSVNYSKDRNNVYFCYFDVCKILSWADAETFVQDWKTWIYEDKFWRYIKTGYGYSEKLVRE